MKSFTKFCLIFCAVLAVLGFVGIGAGLALGATPSQILDLAHYPGLSNKKLDVIDEIEDSLDDLPGGSSDRGGEWGEEHYEFDMPDRMDLNLSLCELDIECWEGDMVILEAENTRDTFQCSMEDGVLTLKDDRDTPMIGESMKDALRIRLRLPEQAIPKAKILVSVGTLDIDRLLFGDLSLENGVGTLKAGTLEGDTAALSLGVGECGIDRLTARESCLMEMGTCDVDLDWYEGADLSLDCGVGDVSLTAAGKETDYNYTLDCGAGEIRLDYGSSSGHHDEEHETHHDPDDPGHHIEYTHQADRNIDITCALGDLELKFKEN